jgi:hypothetical protein
VEQAADKELARRELEQFALFLADVEEAELEKMRGVCEQLGYVPQGWRVPERTVSH